MSGDFVFDDIERSDASPAAHAEAAFPFLNRVAGPFWDRARGTVDAWYARLPADAQPDLRGRLRSGNDRQFTAAFWEMYVHEYLIREGFDVSAHPDLPDTPNRPDFLARRDAAAFYVEATVVGEPAAEAASEARKNVVYDSLNKLESPNFFLGIRVHEEGLSSPSARRLRGELERWLATLDPDAVGRQMEVSGLDVAPTYSWEADGWVVEFEAIPKNEKSRGKPGIRPLGMWGPGRVVATDGVGQLRTDLVEKAGRYGRPDLPFVIATSVESPFFDDEFTASGALFGQEAMQFDPQTLEATPIRHPNGFWWGPDGPRHTRVSGVVVARNIRPWHFVDREPVMWHNPWATIPMPDVLPCESRAIDLEAGVLETRAARRKAYEVLGVPADWPGPEDPFPRED